MSNCISHRRGTRCPVEGNQCDLLDNIYIENIKCENIEFNYIGMSAPPLRYRVATHKQSFKSCNNQTELSCKIKELDQNNIKYDLTFKLLENKKSYNPEIRKCHLCTAESYHILYSHLENILNSKNEITSKCRHRSRFKLCNLEYS